MILSLDIGGMSTKIAFIDEEFNIVQRDIIKYKICPINWKTLSWLLKSKIKTFDLDKINSITVSCPGAINSETGEVLGKSAIEELQGINIKDFLYNNFKKPTFVANDSNCAALAELKLGNAQNLKNGLLVVIGTGIGSSIIINNKIFSGSNWFAGEFGTGIEKFFSNQEKEKFQIPYLYSSFFALYGACLKYKMITGTEVDGKTLFKQYNVDENSKNIVDEMILGLAKTICNAFLVTNPETILIGGAVSQNKLFMELLEKKIRYIIEKLMFIKSPFEFKNCKFFNDSNLIGAALLSKEKEIFFI